MTEENTDTKPNHQATQGRTVSAPDAHNHIEDNLEIRPFNEEKINDGQWNYIHRAHAHIAVQKAVLEGMVLFAGWLVDNKEGQEIDEDLLAQWGCECAQENNVR